jgi:hypothetical protein
VGEAGQLAVVVADHRHVIGHAHAGTHEHVEEPDRAAVVRRDHRGGWLRLGQQRPRRCGARRLDVPAGQHPPVEAVTVQGGEEALAPVGRHGRLAAVDVHDPAVAEPDQVVDGLADAGLVGHPHHVETFRGDVPRDHHQRRSRTQRAQRGRRQLGGQQEDRLAAHVEQRLDDPGLVGDRGDRAQRHGVPARVRGDLHLLRQLGPERVAQQDRDAEQAGTAAREHARRAVGAVAEPLGGRQHALAGPGARPGHVAQHERDRRGRDARLGGDVLQSRPAVHVHPLDSRRRREDRTEQAKAL